MHRHCCPEGDDDSGAIVVVEDAKVTGVEEFHTLALVVEFLADVVGVVASGEESAWSNTNRSTSDSEPH